MWLNFLDDLGGKEEREKRRQERIFSLMQTYPFISTSTRVFTHTSVGMSTGIRSTLAPVFGQQLKDKPASLPAPTYRRPQAQCLHFQGQKTNTTSGISNDWRKPIDPDQLTPPLTVYKAAWNPRTWLLINTGPHNPTPWGSGSRCHHPAWEERKH